MSMLRSAFSFGTHSALIALVVFAPRVSAQQVRGDSANHVDSLFANWTGPGAPGCALAVARGGQTLLTRAYGLANLEYGVPNTPETVFEAGSVSKQFTAAAIVLLAQQGKLALDDPVRKYVPELPDYGAPLTIRQMLNHTSGLRDWGVVVAAAGWPRGTRVHTQAHVLEVASRQKSLNYPSGSEYLYSNTNYNLAAMIVERVSGISFPEFTRRNLFEPLGMSHTQWRDDYTRTVKGRATAYARQQDGYHLDMPFENVFGNGGLLTTVGDLLIWNENFVTPRVGGRALVDELQRQGKLTSGRTIEYAEGLFVTTYRGVPEVSHSGSTAGYRAFLARWPRQNLSLALLCNSGGVNPDDLGHRIAETFLGRDLQPIAPSTVRSISLPASELAARAGRYRNVATNELMQVVLQNDTLRFVRGGAIVPLSRTEYVSPNGRWHARFDDANGRPARLHLVAPTGDTLELVATTEFTPEAPQLAEYVGSYRSDEAGSSLSIALDAKGQLVVRTGVNGTQPLTPAYPDAFTAPQGIVLFRRDAAGKVNALSLGLGRVRDLRFDRVGTS